MVRFRWWRTQAVVALLVGGACAGCGGGSPHHPGRPDAGHQDIPDGGAPDAGHEPFEAFFQTAPGNDAVEVDVRPAISATVSTSHEGTPWKVESFEVKRGDTPVSGAVTLAPPLISFQPAGRLALLRRYTAALQLRFEPSPASPLVRSHQWGFTVRDGRWQAEPHPLLADAVEGISEQRVRVDGDGNAIAAWIQREQGQGSVWYNRYIPGVGWEGARRIAPEDPEDVLELQLAMDARGNAMAVWVRYTGGPGGVYALWYSRYVRGQGWQAAQAVESTVTGDSSLPRLVMGADGAATVVWLRFNGLRETVWTGRYTSGEGWGQFQQLDTAAKDDAMEPDVGLGEDGTAMALWSQSDGGLGRIYARSYSPGQGWGKLQQVSLEGAGPGSAPRVAIGPQGSAVAVWLTREVEGLRVWSGRYLAAAGWQEVSAMDVKGFNAAAPQVVVDSQGRATAVWMKFDGRRDTILSSHYVPEAGWSSPALLDSAGTGNSVRPALAMDASGNALAVWEQGGTSGRRVWSSRYVRERGWGVASAIDTAQQGTSVQPQLAVTPDGYGMAIWSHELNGMTRLVINSFQ